MKYWVYIFEKIEIENQELEKVVRKVSCGKSEKRVERIENGMNINMNHERFFTRIIAEIE